MIVDHLSPDASEAGLVVQGEVIITAVQAVLFVDAGGGGVSMLVVLLVVLLLLAMLLL